MLSAVVCLSVKTKSEGCFSKSQCCNLVDITTIDAHDASKFVIISHLLDFADLFRQRMKMLQAVKVQAQAITSMQATDHACLLYQDYLGAFRIQQQAQQGNRRPRFFPEHDIRFAFEEGGMIFGVNRPGADRSGIPLWTGNCQRCSQQNL